MASHKAHDIDSTERTEDVKINESITFQTMLLPNFILDGLSANGFKKPSPIQLAAIPRARCGLDLIVQAKSGTGKTLVFTITALESIDIGLKRVQVIILAPTREIAFQITDVIRSVGQSVKGLKVETFVGGKNLNCDKPLLHGCQIAVGCPGRIRHLIEQKFLDSLAVRLLVLDEADRLFDGECDFQKDINFIFNKCGESKQVLAVSATYPEPLLDFTRRFMRSGQVVTPAGGPTPVLLGLRQFVLLSKDHPDYNARLSFKEKELFNLLGMISFDLCCIFHHYASRAESMNNILRKKGFTSVCLTGKQSMEERMDAMAAIKSGKCRILVTTDLAARGIDSSSINLVVNMGIPWNPASYLHRMGRAGRYGSQGVCISLISEGMELNKFQKLLGKIGGTSMAVNVMPKLRKFDVWNDDLDDFDKVYGIESLDGEVDNDEHNPTLSIDSVIVRNNNIEIKYKQSSEEQKKSSREEQKKQSREEQNNKPQIRIKNIENMSMLELQTELNKFVEEEKNSKKIKELKKEKRAAKMLPLSYSQMVAAGKKSNETFSLSDSSDSEENPTKSVRTLPQNFQPTPVAELNGSKMSKRKRSICSMSSSSEFESGSYDLDDDGSLSDDTMFTVDEVEEEDSRSGIDLNAEKDDFESLSDISCDQCDSNASQLSCPRCRPYFPHANEYYRAYNQQTDWYSVLSQEINNYVMYCRRFRMTC